MLRQVLSYYTVIRPICFLILLVFATQVQAQILPKMPKASSLVIDDADNYD